MGATPAALHPLKNKICGFGYGAKADEIAELFYNFNYFLHDLHVFRPKISVPLKSIDTLSQQMEKNSTKMSSI